MNNKYFIYRILFIGVILLGVLANFCGCAGTTTILTQPTTTQITTIITTTVVTNQTTIIQPTVTVTFTPAETTETSTENPTEITITSTPAIPDIAYVKIINVGTYSDDADDDAEGIKIYFTFYDSLSNILTFDSYSYSAHIERWTDNTDGYIHKPPTSDCEYKSAGLLNQIRMPTTGLLNYLKDTYILTITTSDGQIFEDEWDKI